MRTLLGLVNDDRSDLPDEGGLPLSLLRDLTDIVRCDMLSFFASSPGMRELSFYQEAAPIEISGVDEDAVVRHYWDCLHCSYGERSGDLRSVTRASDFYSARQWHDGAMYTEYFKPFGIEHLISVTFPESPDTAACPGSIARLVFFRGPGPDFSERDRALLALMRPHLYQAYVDTARRRNGPPPLTARHLELLRLVAAGHTNSQIARRLGITEGTVRTHLQAIYRRLNVSSRTAAVTRAFPNQAAT